MSSPLPGRSELLGSDFQAHYPTSHYYYTPHVEDKWLAISRGNYGYPDFPPGAKNIGGPFVLRGGEVIYTPSASVDIWRGGPNAQHYRGKFIPWSHGPSQPAMSIADGSPNPWAAEAFSKMKPTAPLYSALNGAYELREVPDLLRQRLSDSPLRNIGSYYLALKFGWEALLGDIRNLVIAQRDAQKRIAQLLRDNGRPVRRRVNLAAAESERVTYESTGYWALQPVLVQQYYVSQPKFTESRIYRERIWASARFRYWLPGGPRDIAWKRRLLAELFGARPSPATIYNMIPWTWLIDWFLNLGYVIDNLDAGVADRLAADYIYIMRHMEWRTDYQATGLFESKNGDSVPVSTSAVRLSYMKSREAGGPFDPALNQRELTPTQWAIGGALGLSRL